MFRRYARLLGVRLKASSLLAMQYQADFLVDGAISVFWMATALVPLFVVFQNAQRDIEGWSFGESLLVIGWFTLLQGVLEGAINPSLTGVVEHIRKGTLDFVLLKPADAQFLVSTERFLPWRALNVFAALLIFGYGFHLIGRAPSVLGVALSLVLLGASVLLLYSLWILTVCVAFYVVKIDNLTYLFTSIFDAARWPAPVFRGALAFVFTFVIPLAVMTTFPAEALLGRLPWTALVWSLGGSVLFALFSRRVWRHAIGRYTSASS